MFRTSIVAWAGLIVLGMARAAVPAAILEMDRQAADHPVGLLASADADQAAARDDGRRLHVWLQQALAASVLERYDRLERIVPSALRLAVAKGDADAWCVLAAEDVVLRHHQEGLAAAVAGANAALQRARGRGLQTWCTARLYHAQGRVLDLAGRRADAAVALAYAQQQFESAGHQVKAATVLGQLGWLTRGVDGDATASGKAIEQCSAALAMLGPAPPRYLAGSMHHDLGGVLLSANRTADARRHLDVSLRLAREIDDTTGAAYVQRLLAAVDIREQKPLRALPLLEHAAETFARNGIDDMQHVALTMRADALLVLSRPEEALRALQQAEVLRRRLDLADLDIEHWRIMLKTQALLQQPKASAVAAEAYARALQRRERESRRKALADAQARFDVERREAENTLLRAQSQAAQTRQKWLWTCLALAMMLLAALAWHAVQQRRTRQVLKRLAEVDELTQLPNRRAVLAELERFTQEASRKGRMLAVAMCDIDHFKQVNDRYGHETGDEALRHFARTCAAALRAEDRIGRLGGEEFLVLLAQTDGRSIAEVFNRMLGALQSAPVRGMPDGERLSFSMGVAAWTPGASGQVLVQRADEALYIAKAAGRRRVQTWESGAVTEGGGSASEVAAAIGSAG